MSHCSARAPHRLCASSPVRLIMAACSLMAVLLLSPVAHAGSYVWQTTDANGGVTAESPAYTGGTVTSTSPSSSLLQFTTHPPYTNTPPNPFYIGVAQGGCSTDAQGHAASVTLAATGKLTAKFTWHPAYPGEPAPASVIIYQDCRASLTNNRYAPADTSCICTDGLGGSAPLPSDAGQTATESYNYSAGTVASDGTVSVSCTPSSVYNIKCGPGVGYYAAGAANAAYKATAYPITISLTGPIPDSSGNQNILVGQGCTASVSGIPADLLNNTAHPPVYNWSVSGNTFQSWSPTTPSNPNATPPTPANPNASSYVPGSGPLTNATAHWYWNDPANKSETVKCTVTLTPPAGQGAAFSVTVTKNVSVQVPAWTASEIGGYVQVNSHCPNYTGNAFYAGPTATERASGQVGGMNWSANVMSSALFASGTLTLVQLVTPQLSYVTNTGVSVPGVTHNDPENGLYGLDTRYPYTWETQGSYQPPYTPVPYTTSDSPFIGTLNSITSTGMTHLFVDYLLFLPPGSDSKLVPLATNSWSTNGNATIPSTNNWSDYATQHGSDSAGTVSPATSTPFTAGNAFPSWTRINVFPSF